MEQIEPISHGVNAALPPAVPEPRWDPEKATKRKVRVIKVPYDQDPMKEKTVFEFNGFVYICYAKKTRGRSMIRCLGMSVVEPEHEPFKDAINGDGIKEAIDKDIIEKVVKEAEVDAAEDPLDLAVTNFRASKRAEGHGES